MKPHLRSTDDLHRMVNEMSLSLSESNHVETIEEANDFEINDEGDADFLQNLTVYEMHDQAEENLQLLPQINQLLAESNETGVQGAEPPPQHAQSAPDEPNSLEDQVDKPSPNIATSQKRQILPSLKP
nr:MAG: hypothetical protein [Microvirus sp.]